MAQQAKPDVDTCTIEVIVFLVHFALCLREPYLELNTSPDTPISVLSEFWSSQNPDHTTR